RRPFTRHIDRTELGYQECERWSVGAELMVRVAEEQPFVEPIFHIHYHDLVNDPVGSVKKLYRHFGLIFDAKTATRIGGIVQANPNGGYGVNRYRIDDYGMDANEIEECFARYVALFCTGSEPNEDGCLTPLLTRPRTEIPAEASD